MALFNFLRQVAQGDEEAGGGVFGFLDDVVRAETPVQQTGRDLLREGVTRPVATFARSLAEGGERRGGQATIRAVEDLRKLSYEERKKALKENRGLALVLKNRGITNPTDANLEKAREETTRETEESAREGFTPGSRAEQTILGKEPVQSYQQRGRGIEEETGIPAPIAGVGLLGLDAPTGGGKAAKSIGKQLIDADTVGKVKKVLGGQVPDEIAERVAPALARTKDPNVIGNIIERASGRTPATQIRRTIDGVVPGGQPGQAVDDVLPGGAPQPQAPQVGEVAEEAAGQADDPFDTILRRVRGEPAAPGQAPQRGLKSASREQAKLLSKERGARFRAGQEAGAGVEGSEGYFRELGALKGQYSKVEFDPLIKDIGPEQAEDLFAQARRKITETPDDVYKNMGLHPQGARVNTQRAVRKVIGLEPGLPTKSEIKLLEAYSPELANEISDSLPTGRRIFDAASTLFGNVRSLKSSLDLSMGGRQGLFVAARHPITWAKANKESVKYAKDSKYFDDAMKSIRNDEWGKLGDKVGLALQGTKEGSEEAFPALDVAGKVPLVKRSERAYTGGLTKLRYDLWESRLKAFGDTPEEAAEALGNKGLRSMAEAINTLTGRGGKKGGFVGKHANTLQEALFSPRLWASRLKVLSPKFYADLEPAARKEALESAGAFAAVAGVVLGAAAASGAEVETDARSSDFLKIKSGDTRYDILGGLQQNLVFAWRQLTGESKSSQTGNVSQFGRDVGDVIAGREVEPEFGGQTRFSAAIDMFRNKSNPIFGTGATILEGKDRGGEGVNPLVEIAKLFVPINAENVFEQIKDNKTALERTKAVAKQAPEFVGIGSQTYGVKDINLSKTQKSYVERLQEEGAPEDRIEATERFYQYQKRGPDRDEASEKIKEALAEGNQERAIKIAKDYNEKYKTSFDEWRKQYGQHREDEQLVKDYQSKFITDRSFGRWISDIRRSQ